MDKHALDLERGKEQEEEKKGAKVTRLFSCVSKQHCDRMRGTNQLKERVAIKMNFRFVLVLSNNSVPCGRRSTTQTRERSTRSNTNASKMRK
jgi:hypothetical protein